MSAGNKEAADGKRSAEDDKSKKQPSARHKSSMKNKDFVPSEASQSSAPCIGSPSGQSSSSGSSHDSGYNSGEEITKENIDKHNAFDSDEDRSFSSLSEPVIVDVCPPEDDENDDRKKKSHIKTSPRMPNLATYYDDAGSAAFSNATGSTASAGSQESHRDVLSTLTFRGAFRLWAISPVGIFMWCLAALALLLTITLGSYVYVVLHETQSYKNASEYFSSSEMAEGYSYDPDTINIVVSHELESATDFLNILVPAYKQVSGRNVVVQHMSSSSSLEVLDYVRSRPLGDFIALMELPDIINNDTFHDYGMDALAFFSYDPIVIAAPTSPKKGGTLYNNVSDILNDAEKHRDAGDILKIAYPVNAPCLLLTERSSVFDERVTLFDYIPMDVAEDAIRCAVEGDCAAVCTMASQVASHKDTLKGLAVSSTNRVGELPNTPTFVQIGFLEETQTSILCGFAVPKTMDEDKKKELLEVITTVSADRTVVNSLYDLGVVPILYSYPFANVVWYENWKRAHDVLFPLQTLSVLVLPILFALVILILIVDVIVAVVVYYRNKRKLLQGFETFEAQHMHISSPVAVVLRICSTLKPVLSPRDQLRIEQVMSLLVEGSKVEMETSVFSREDNQYLATLTNLPLQSRDRATGITVTTTANSPNAGSAPVIPSKSKKAESEREIEMDEVDDAEKLRGLDGDGESKDEASKSKMDSNDSAAPYAKLLSLCSVLDEWSFNCFSFARKCRMHTLPVSCVYLWKKFNLLDDHDMTADRVYSWAQRMEALYFDNPFHNSTHATDVLQATAWFISRKEIASWMTHDDILALLFSAVIHDVGHVARRNDFLSLTNSSLAITFNDQSVLENNSLALAFGAMADNDRVNLFLHFSPDRRRAIRKKVIALVRATDLAAHFKLVDCFKAKLDMGKFDPSTNDDDCLLLQEIVLKLADLAGLFRPFPIGKHGATVLFEEFLQQGDEEKALGLPVSQFMDRNHTSLDKCEVIFIETFCIPLMQAYHRYSSSADEPSLLLMGNYEKWKHRAKNAKMTYFKVR